MKFCQTFPAVSAAGRFTKVCSKPASSCNLEKLVRWPGATFYADALLPHGPSLTDRYTHDLNVVSNIDAYDSPRLDEIWLEQKLFGDALSLRLGELAIDTEFFISESGTLFLNSCFGAPPIIGANFNAPAYPLAAPGVRLEWKITPSVLVRAGAFSGDPGDSQRTNTHGGRISFTDKTGLLTLAEAVYQTGAGVKDTPEAGLPGTFKLGGFYHSGEFADVSNNGATHRGIAGVYAVVDQALYRESTASRTSAKDAKTTADSADAEQGLNFFTRGGTALPEDRNLVTGYLEAGLTYKGLLPGRDSDTLGCACTCTCISRDARGDAGEALTSHHETVLEASYQAAITDWLTVQPDFQYIIRPGATGRLPNATVIGARFTLSF